MYKVLNIIFMPKC